MNHLLSNRICFLAALAGVGVSITLTMSHLRIASVPCGPLHGCDTVAAHPTAAGFGIPALSAIPTAAFGLAMFLVMAGLCFARAATPTVETAQRLGLVQWLMALASVAASGYLTYLEAYVIHAWCTWCVASALLVIVLFVVLSWERIALRRAQAAPAGDAVPLR